MSSPAGLFISRVVEGRRIGLSNDDLPFMFLPEHSNIAERARRVAVEVIELEHASDSATQDVHSEDIHRQTLKLLGSAGLLSAVAIAHDEGWRADLRALCLTREALGYVSGSADSLFAVQGLGTFPVAAFGSAAQQAEILGPAMTGEHVGGFALTEPEAGTDVAAMTTEVVAIGEHLHLTGKKIFISNAPIADHLIVFAREQSLVGAKGPAHKQISAFIVRRGLPGFAVDSNLPLLADHAIGIVTFDNVLLTQADRLGTPGGGFAIAMATLDTFRVTVGAAAVGMARRALDEALHHAATRKQFGKPLGDQQQVQAMLADSVVELDAARLLVLRAAKLYDEGASITREAAMAKLYATEVAQKIIDRSLQIHGGMGVVRGVAVERLYREIRALRIYEGTSEIQRVVIATRMLKDEQSRIKAVQ